MKILTRLISFLLVLIIIINTASKANAAERVNNDTSDGFHLFSVPIESTESLNDSVTFYELDGKYYLCLDDITDLTRYTLTEDAEKIELTQGMRNIIIDKSTGDMTDSDIVDQGKILLREYNGKYLCEGIPMLIYLGATCNVNNQNKLEVLMPAFTIWESIMPDYLDYYFNIKEMYGGEDNVKISLICDIIADILDGVSGHGLFSNADEHLEDALYEIINVDMMKYSSVQETASAQIHKTNDFLNSAVLEIMFDTSDNLYDAVYSAIDYYSRFFVSTKNDILLDMLVKTDDLTYASELASKIKEQVYSQAATKVNLKNAKEIQKYIDIGMLAFDTAITTYNLLQYDDDTKNIFSRTINQEMFEYADYNEISWNNVSDKISDTLKNTKSIVINTTIDKVAEYTVNKISEKGVEKALSAFTSKANIYTASLQIGSFIASLINYKSNQAFSADMNAIWLSAVQYDIAMLVSKLMIKERDEFHFSSAESLEKLKNMLTLYYRVTIAFSENIARSIEEFGTKANKELVPWFSSTTENSVGNYTADYLYRITNCTIIPIVDYSELSDELISDEWIRQFKMSNTTIFEKMPSDFIFSSGAGGWFTKITLSDDGTFTGQYYDADLGFTGDEYPNGTVYICNFNGKFTTPKEINEYIYSMNLDSLNVEGTPGTEYFENGTKYVVSDPYGFENADEFLIYLPGCPLEDADEDFLSWSFINRQIRQTIPAGVYGIYNVGGMEGFMGEDENSLWKKTYSYSYNSCISELQPTYYSESHLVFWPESGPAILDISFNWSEDDQTEFPAGDSLGTGAYSLMLDFNEDLSSVQITLRSISGFSLEPWGGSADGILKAEYTLKPETSDIPQE